MTTNRRPYRTTRRTPPGVAREAAAGYDAGGAQEDVRDAARDLARAAQRLVSLAAKEGRAEGGELGALRTTLSALDAAQAAAVELTSHVQRRGSAERACDRL